ncbi:MAG: heme-binding protein, partial [Desulfuromonadales bacterium]|nr:heme-binding protein [Desulfuromonadales bacterium]NIS42784.1 heme-binding protein [Desulfuromonadales bacterium]
TVVKSFADFELRQYEPYIVAEIHARGDFDEIGGKAFRTLFGYISEDERPQGKLDMTVPVIQQPLPEQAGAKSYRFAFVMPPGYSLEELPTPADSAVQINNVPARLMAARRYSGTWSEKR